MTNTSVLDLCNATVVFAVPLVRASGPASVVIDPVSAPPAAVLVCDIQDDNPVPPENTDMQLTRCAHAIQAMYSSFHLT